MQLQKIEQALPLREGDVFLNRLVHAVAHTRGLALDLIKEAVISAAKTDRKLQNYHFANRYREKTLADDNHNPFLVHDWTHCDRNKLLEVTVAARRDARTLK